MKTQREATKRPHFACPECGSETIGVWRQQHVLRSVTGWTEDGEPTRCDGTVLNHVDGEYTAPWFIDGRLFRCDHGHEFNEPKRVED